MRKRGSVESGNEEDWVREGEVVVEKMRNSDGEETRISVSKRGDSHEERRKVGRREMGSLWERVRLG